jgi:hypothetical protein
MAKGLVATVLIKLRREHHTHNLSYLHRQPRISADMYLAIWREEIAQAIAQAF